MKHLLIGALLMTCGCAFGPVAFDPNEQVWPMDADLINGPVRMELIPVNGRELPAAALTASMGTINQYIAGPVTTSMGGSVLVPLDEEGYVTKDAMLTIIGFRTVTGKGSVTIVTLPKMREHNKGFSARLNDGGQLIVLYADAMDITFVSRDRVFELVLTHEFGHALGVPYAKTHKWKRNHCTYPTCLMYPGADFRAVWSTIVNLGFYDDYCEVCQKELVEVRNGH